MLRGSSFSSVCRESVSCRCSVHSTLSNYTSLYTVHLAAQISAQVGSCARWSNTTLTAEWWSLPLPDPSSAFLESKYRSSTEQSCILCISSLPLTLTQLKTRQQVFGSKSSSHQSSHRHSSSKAQRGQTILKVQLTIKYYNMQNKSIIKPRLDIKVTINSQVKWNKLNVNRNLWTEHLDFEFKSEIINI